MRRSQDNHRNVLYSLTFPIKRQRIVQCHAVMISYYMLAQAEEEKWNLLCEMFFTFSTWVDLNYVSSWVSGRCSNNAQVQSMLILGNKAGMHGYIRLFWVTTCFHVDYLVYNAKGTCTDPLRTSCGYCQWSSKLAHIVEIQKSKHRIGTLARFAIAPWLRCLPPSMLLPLQGSGSWTFVRATVGVFSIVGHCAETLLEL